MTNTAFDFANNFMKYPAITLLFFTQLFYSVELKAHETQSLISSESNAEQTQEVEISSMKDPDWKSYRTMLKGLDVFKVKHAFAPTADLQFVLIPTDHHATNFNDVKLRIAGNETSIPVPISDNGTFVLLYDKNAENENADLILNQKKSLWRWRPYVRSLGLKPNQRRLGDLRLECEVRWAVEYDDLPFLMRNAFRMAGGPCKSSNINVNFYTAQKIAAAGILIDGKYQAISFEQKGYYFSPPLYDDKLNDDTLIELEFADVGR